MNTTTGVADAAYNNGDYIEVAEATSATVVTDFDSPSYEYSYNQRICNEKIIKYLNQIF